MNYRLRGVSPNLLGQTISVHSERPMIVGRVPDADICVPEAYVSRRHCVLFQRGDDLLVRDENSRNGTYVNGTRLSSADQILREGDILQLSEAVFLIDAFAGITADTPNFVAISGT